MTEPLTEGYIRKGGQNSAVSQVQDRPDAPASMRPNPNNQKQEPMKTYQSHKIVNAKPMTRQEYNDFRGWQLPADENGDDKGYLVEYTDGGKANTSDYKGYVSWSPCDVFHKGHRLIDDAFDFGTAVRFLKEGKKVSRVGWNGKGMFVFYVPANKYHASGNKNGTLLGHFPDDMVPYRDYIAMKTVNDEIVPWVASQSDVLAEDWCAVS